MSPWPPNARASGHNSLQNNSKSNNQTDIRTFLMEGKCGDSNIQQPTGKTSFSTKIEMDDPVDKMRLIRNKMVEARREADNAKDREARMWIGSASRTPSNW